MDQSVRGPGAWLVLDRSLQCFTMASIKPNLFLFLQRHQSESVWGVTMEEGGCTWDSPLESPPSPGASGERNHVEPCGLTFLRRERTLCYCWVVHARWAVGIVFFFLFFSLLKRKALRNLFLFFL